VGRALAAGQGGNDRAQPRKRRGGGEGGSVRWRPMEEVAPVDGGGPKGAQQLQGARGTIRLPRFEERGARWVTHREGEVGHGGRLRGEGTEREGWVLAQQWRGEEGKEKKGVRLAWHGAHVGRAPRAAEWGVEHVVRVAGSGRVRSDDACGRRKNRESEAIERDRLGVGSSDREKRWVDRPEGGAQLVGKEREKGQLPWPWV
jgi:hypothetical protein